MYGISLAEGVLREVIYPDDYINRVICGDCLEVMRGIPDESVDLIFTDPPFFIRKQIIIHRKVNPRKYEKKDYIHSYKYQGKDIVVGWDWDSQWKDEEEYLVWVKTWYQECARILRKGGHLLIFFDRLRQWWLWKYGTECNMITRQPLYFILTNPVPRARQIDFMGAIYSIFWQTKETYSRKVATFHWEFGQHKNYIEVPITPTPRNRERHPTEKHPNIIKWLLKYLSNENDIIADFFAGTGVVGEVAKKMKRRYILVETQEKYCRIAEKRLKSIPESLFNQGTL